MFHRTTAAESGRAGQERARSWFALTAVVLVLAGASGCAGSSAAQGSRLPSTPAPDSTVPAAPISPGWIYGCKGTFQHVEKGKNAGPLSGERILQIGDSLTTNAAAPSEAVLDRTGASYLIDAMPGSSPIDKSSLFPCVEWQQELPRLVAAFKPTIVIGEFCCNYWFPAGGPDGRPIEPGAIAFRDLWQQAIGQMATTARHEGAQVYWVVTPPSAQYGPGGLIDQTNEAVLRLVGDGLIDVHHLVRWDLALTGGTGVYQATLDGRPVRESDGLHIASPFGAELVAQATWAALVPPRS